MVQLFGLSVLTFSFALQALGLSVVVLSLAAMATLLIVVGNGVQLAIVLAVHVVAPGWHGGVVDDFMMLESYRCRCFGVVMSHCRRCPVAGDPTLVVENDWLLIDDFRLVIVIIGVVHCVMRGSAVPYWMVFYVTVAV